MQCLNWFPPPPFGMITLRTGPAIMNLPYVRNNTTGNWEPVGKPQVSLPVAFYPKNVTYRDELMEVIQTKRRSLQCVQNYQPTLGLSTFTCYRNLWANYTPDALPDGACRFDLLIDYEFRDLLDIMQAELDRAIILFNDNGDIAAASLGKRNNQTCFGVCAGGESISLNRTWDSIAENVRTDLKTLYGSYANIPTTPQILYRRINDTDFVVSVSAFNLTEVDTYILAAVVPYDQVFGNIDRANGNSIIIFIVVTVGVVSISGVAMWFSLKPLYTLSVAMESLTRFDFAVLEEGKLLDVRSFIMEIAHIQTTFSVMVKAFAGGIRSNRMLVGPSSAVTNSGPVTSGGAVEDTFNSAIHTVKG
ncbi:hypothetical protein HK102_014167 [Quaeritorhiza haematococci]|nr:hypothetical protein HK102_014167 [Quaeritorhiza haematococci]